MTSDLSKITSGLGPSATRLEILIERALELSQAIAATPHNEQDVALTELKKLFAQITETAHDTADCIVASAGYAR
jgi:hypothetical protein